MNSCDRHAECVKILSEDAETKIRRNAVTGMASLCGTASHADREKAIDCFKNIMYIIDGIKPDNYIHD